MREKPCLCLLFTAPTLAAAYSSLARLPDGRIGGFYESGGYKQLPFAAFGLVWLNP